jgi:hypothetical protein
MKLFLTVSLALLFFAPVPVVAQGCQHSIGAPITFLVKGGRIDGNLPRWNPPSGTKAGLSYRVTDIRYTLKRQGPIYELVDPAD